MRCLRCGSLSDLNLKFFCWPSNFIKKAECTTTSTAAKKITRNIFERVKTDFFRFASDEKTKGFHYLLARVHRTYVN